MYFLRAFITVCLHLTWDGDTHRRPMLLLSQESSVFFVALWHTQLINQGCLDHGSVWLLTRLFAASKHEKALATRLTLSLYMTPHWHIKDLVAYRHHKVHLCTHRLCGPKVFRFVLASLVIFSSSPLLFKVGHSIMKHARNPQPLSCVQTPFNGYPSGARPVLAAALSPHLSIDPQAPQEH